MTGTGAGRNTGSDAGGETGSEPDANPISQGGTQNEEAPSSPALNRADQLIQERDQRTRLQQPDPLIPPDSYQVEFFRGLQHISIQDLMKDKLKIRNMQFKCLDLQLLKIIVSKPDDKQGRYSYRRNEKQTAGFQYSRMFLCRVLDMNSPTSSRECVYLVETAHENRDLWCLDIASRDCGVICPGSFFRIFDIQQARYNIGNVPCLVSNGQAIVLKTPVEVPEVAIRSNIQANYSNAFTLNNCKLGLFRVTPWDTKCGGYFCDKQGAWQNPNPKCGCYGTPKGRSNMVLCLQLDVCDPITNDVIVEEEHYSSQQFSKYYSIGEFKPDTNKREFSMSSEFRQLESAMHNCIDHVNDNDGWTVFGWYRKGQIDDKILTGMEDDTAKMEGNVTAHVVSIIPDKCRFSSARISKISSIAWKKV